MPTYPRKPHLWANDYVRPEWQWVWRKLVFASLQQGGAGDHVPRRDVVGRLNGTSAGTGSHLWQPTSSGIGCGQATADTSIHVAYDGTNTDLQLPGSWTIAVLARTDRALSSSTAGWSLGKGGSGDAAGNNHNFLLGYNSTQFNDDQSGAGWMILYEDGTGANFSVKALEDVPALTTNLIMGVFDTGANELKVGHRPEQGLDGL